jgi:hypothetical protein
MFAVGFVRIVSAIRYFDAAKAFATEPGGCPSTK